MECPVRVLSIGWLSLFFIAVHGCSQPAVPAAATKTVESTTAQATPTLALSTPTQEKPVPDSIVPLIPRTELFGNPDRAMARISPDGKQLAYLAPVDNVLNVWVCPIGELAEAKPVTQDKKRGVRNYFWAYNNTHLLYSQDQDGDEDWHIYGVDLVSGKTTDLTPFPKIAAQVQEVSERFPDEILIAINNRNEQYHDIHRVNLKTGERSLVQENPDFAGFTTDDDFRVRFAEKMLPDGSQQWYQPDGKGGWTEFEKIGYEDSLTTQIGGFDKSGEKLYLIDSRGRDTAAFTIVDLATRKSELIAEHPKSDINGVLAHPTEKTIQAVSFNYERHEWKILDPAIQADMDFLKTVKDGEIQIPSRTLDDTKWLVAYLRSDGPVSYYFYDRATKTPTFLFTNRASLEKLPLVKMHSRVVKTRDGLDMVCYLSLPKESDPNGDGKPSHPLPMVLDVHGGPWARDDYGYNPEHQLMANRGYAILSVNYRGSTGFGKKFLNCAAKEWAGKMHDDLIDAVDWAVSEGIAQPDKVAISGGSYGGYATLVGLTFTPDKFACGIDIVGPSNLRTLLASIPPYWAPMIQMFKDRVGDPDTEEGRRLLEERSPLNYVEKIKRPLLIAQGANDPRVKQAEADQIVKAMQSQKIPVTYVLFPDEGHGFARPENRLAFQAVTEAFLAKQLGGRMEPIGKDFQNSTITVPNGADGVPGLGDSLPPTKP
jgi:dipeptidyl aminopeptidase/acylaminoacyl peptidase